MKNERKTHDVIIWETNNTKKIYNLKNDKENEKRFRQMIMDKGELMMPTTMYTVSVGNKKNA